MTGTLLLEYIGPQESVEVQEPGTGAWLLFERGVPREAPELLAYGGRAEVIVLDGEPLGSETAGLLVQGVEELDPSTGLMVLTEPWWRVAGPTKPTKPTKPTTDDDDAAKDSQ